MLRFAKAHAYGNDFLYVRATDVAGAPLGALAREMCDRHAGIGADGLITYERTSAGTSMRLYNADGSRAEVSGNGVRALAAVLLEGNPAPCVELSIETESGTKRLTRVGSDGSRHMFRAAMGLPSSLRQLQVAAAGESIEVVALNMGNPQCVVLGELPDETRFSRLGAALERHELFPNRTNVEFVRVDSPSRVTILIWERGVGPTSSSGTGSCAALVAAAAFGRAARSAEVVAPGGAQQVEWLSDSVYLTGWAEVLCRGEWYRQISRTQ